MCVCAGGEGGYALTSSPFVVSYIEFGIVLDGDFEILSKRCSSIAFLLFWILFVLPSMAEFSDQIKTVSPQV